MAVTHTPTGFTGTVDQVAFARMMAMATTRFKVDGPTSWVPTAVTTSDRTVQVAVGAGLACGVRDVTTAADTVQFATNSTGTVRYDALVASYNWSTMAVTFTALTGSTSPPVVNASTTTVDTTKLNRIPGVRYDALIAIVRVNSGQGALTAASVTDMRVWGATPALRVAQIGAYRTLLDVDLATPLFPFDERVPYITGVELVNGGQNIGNNSSENQGFGSASRDTDGFYNPSGTTVVTIPAGLAGLYLIKIVGKLSGGATTTRFIESVLANGSEVVRANGTGDDQATACIPIRLAAGANISVSAFQTTGAVRTLTSELSLHLIGT